MKRKIVESYSIEEAFRVLNKKPKQKVAESAGEVEYDLDFLDVEYDPDFLDDEPRPSSEVAKLESLCKQHNIILIDRSEFDISSYDIEPQNSYENPLYYELDTDADTDTNNVVIAISYDDGRIFIEEDYNNIGMEEGTEYPNAEAFISDYLKHINGITETLNKKPMKKMIESASAPVIPAPYDKYFKVLEIDYFTDDMYEIGDVIDNATILAYLVAKDEYFDYFEEDAFLIDNEDMPVVEIIRDRVYPIDIEEVFGDVDDNSVDDNSGYGTNNQLEGIYFEADDYHNLTSEDLANYAASPTVRKYAQKAIFDKIATSDAILEMTAADFGDGHGDPKGYIFAKDGKVGYIALSPNAYSYVPSISYQDFKDIIEGKALLWYEIGFGDFSGANHYIGKHIGKPVTSVEDVIKECDEESYVNLENLWNL